MAVNLRFEGLNVSWYLVVTQVIPMFPFCCRLHEVSRKPFLSVPPKVAPKQAFQDINDWSMMKNISESISFKYWYVQRDRGCAPV